MKLSDISNIQVEPGIYVVYAVFDGDDQYNAKKVSWQLTVNKKSTPAPARARQVTDPDYTDPVKRNPIFYFNPTTVTIDETQGSTNEIDLRDYLVNSDNVSYIVTLSNGLEGVDRDIVRWSSSGTYTITVTSEASTLFNSVTSTLQISATRKQDPLIKYENGTGNIIADGNKLVRRYDYIVDYSSQFYGLQFDIELPNNPYSLPLTYSIVDTTEGTTSGTKFYPNLDIWNYSNKYRDEHGAYNKCTIRATFEGDDTYYPATTEYEGRIYVDYDDINLKRQPNLYFNNLTVYVDQNEQGEYGLQVPVNPDGLYYYYATNQGSIVDNKLHYDGTGQVTITAVIPETNVTKRWLVSYTLLINQTIVKETPVIVFPKKVILIPAVTTEFALPKVINYNDVIVDYTVTGGTIQYNTYNEPTQEGDKILFDLSNYDIDTDIIVTATSRATSTFNSATDTCIIRKQRLITGTDYVYGKYIYDTYSPSYTDFGYFKKFYQKDNSSGYYELPPIWTGGLYPSHDLIYTTITARCGNRTVSAYFLYQNGRIVPTLINCYVTGPVLVQIKVQEGDRGGTYYIGNTYSFIVVITPENEKKTLNLLSKHFDYDKMPVNYIEDNWEYSIDFHGSVHFPIHITLDRLFIWHPYIDTDINISFPYIVSNCIHYSDTTVMDYDGSHEVHEQNNLDINYFDYGIVLKKNGTCDIIINIPSNLNVNKTKTILLHCTVNVT